MSLVKKRRQAEVNTQPVQPVSSQPKSKLYSTITTSYQENLFQPSQSKNWYSGDAPTGREIMGRIGEISKSRPNEAADLYGVYKQLQNDATSRYFNPYTQATNRAVDNLKAMGIDTSNINDDWYQKNSWLKNHYIFSGTTNTPSKPGAKATAEQKAAYEYYQLAKQEEATKKVEQQWDALKEELTYWANRKDRNYSDDEIIGKVDWSKYKSLTDLEDAARLGAPTELNRATDFSRDNMYAVLWAARNNGGSGNMESDLMYSAMGVGNQWKKNQNIADRLDPQSANYNPYSVGSTLEQEGLYFNRESFDQKWLDENRDILSGNDETAIKMYQSVYAAEQKTQKAEAEKAKFDAAFERRLRNAKNPEDAVKWLDRMLGSSDYSTLKAMNESLGNGKLMDTTRAINFSRADYVRKINEACERNNRAPDDDAVVKDISSSVGVHDEPEQNAAPDSTGKIGNIASAGGRLPAATPEQINRANNEQLQEGYSIIQDDMDAAGVTPAEEAVMRNAGSFNFRATTEYLKAVKGTKLDPWDRFSKHLIQKSAGATSTAVLENADTIAEYEQAQKGIDTLYQQSDALKAQIDENVLAGMGLSADDLDFYGKDMPESITETIDVDGTPTEVRLVYDSNLTHKFYLLNDYEVDENNPAVQAAINDANRKRDAAVAAQNLTEEQQAAVDQYKALQDQIDQTNDFLRDGKANYDEAVSRTEDAAKLREATIRLLTKVGADTSELEDTTAVTGFFLDFTKYEPTQWMAYDTYADYAKRMTGESGTAEFSDQVFAEAQAEDEKVMQALEVAQWSMDYANRKGIVLPDGVRNNFERYVAKLQRTHQDFEHLSYLAEPDFNEGVADGREIYARSRDWQENDTPENQPLWDMLTAEQQEEVESLWLNGSQADAASAYENYVSDIHMRGTFGLYQIDNLLTDIERDTWYYLLGTKGAKAAQDYFNYLADPDYGVLNTRSREYTEMAAQEMTDSGLLGFAAANTLSVLLSPVASVGSAIHALDYAGRRANGENPELNPDSPWLTANIFRNATRAESAEQIKETFKDAPVLQTLAQGGYEILTNRADSMMNAATFGSIFPWANNVSDKMFQEFLGASPMGMTAAMDAAAEAKRNGATDGQALCVAGVTFFAETVTEAISLDNIKEAFKSGEEITARTLDEFLKNWLTSAGISEMAGESINDIVEGAADYFIMGDNSEFSRMVQSYIDDGMSEDDARAAAIRDEIGSLLHTALISYLSPGMDIVSFGAGRFHAYRNQTRVLQQNGYNVSVLDVMRMEREGRQERRNRPQPREQATQPAQPAQAAPANEGSAQTPAPGRQTARDFDEAQRLAAEAEAAQRASDEEAVRDWEILETAKGADASVQSSSLAAVLDTGNTQESSDAASAAAVGLWQIFSRGQGNFLLNAMRSSLGDYDLTAPVQNIQRFIVGANEAGVNPAVVKEALQNAVLGGSESAAYQAVTSMQHASPADQARTLAATLEADNANPAVQQNKERAIHEWRVAEAEKQLIANGALDSARDGRDAADAAAQRTNTAQQELAERDAAVEAAGQAIAVAGDEIQKASGDPQRMAEAANQMTHAIAQKEHTVAVQGEYQQKLAKAVADQQAAEQKAKRIKDSAMKLIREQAEQAVAQEDQQRAETAKVAEEQARVQARQQAEAKVEADATETENRLDAETIAGRIAPDATAEDIDTLARIIGEERQKLQQEDAQVEQTLPPEQKEKKKVDRKQRQRDKFREQVSKKFGVEIKVLDTTIGENGQKVNRQNGYYNPKTKSIVIDQETANDDLMYQVLTHEMTHLAEASETYDTLSGILLRNAYGNDSDRLAADIRIKKAQYDFALAQMHAQDSTISNEPLSPEDAAHEIVADLMGNLIKGDKQLIRQFATEEPSAARRFLESLKSFLKKALGMKGAWYDQAQQTVALFEEALNEVQGKTPAMPVRAATEVKGGTKVVRWADGSIRQFNSTADEIARNVLSTYKSNISIKSLSADIQAIRNKVIADDTSAPIDIQELAQQIAASAGMARGNGISALATAMNNYFGSEIAISQEEANSLKRKYGSLAKANQALAATGVKAKMVVGADAGKALDLVFAGDVSSAEGNPAQFELANALGGDYAANMEDVLDRLEHTYSDPHADYLQEVGAGQNIDESTLALDVFDRLTDSIYGNVPYEAQQQKHSLVTNEDGESLADEFTGGTVAVNRQYSLKTWTEEEQNRVRRELLNVKGSDGKNLYTPEQVDKYLNDANGIASIIAADRSRLDFEASDNQVFLKPNNDYYFTLDASTLCAKRLLYQGTFDYVQHALPDEVFTPEDLIDLVNIMNQMGYETPCGICYVESRRRWLDTYAQKFLDELPEGTDKPAIEDLTTSDGLERLRHNDPGMYKAFVDAMNKKGTANPKVVQLRTEYRGDIGKLTARDIQKVKDIGGLRIQSFSDFETPHLLDMVQAVMDMSAVGLTSQAYTKVPNFAWVFGDTGIKINLSLIGKGTGLDADGNLVFDNREGMNFDEAMRLRDRYSKNVGTILVGINDEHIIAAMGDPRIDFIIPFHKSGWSSEELRKMPTLNNYEDYTATQNERMIVGERTNKTVYAKKNAGQKAVDSWIAKEGAKHPGYQVTEVSPGKFNITYKEGYVTESLKSYNDRTKEGIANFEPVGAHAYWDFSKSGEENSRTYLKMCAEAGRIPKFEQFLVDNGDGSFSLPEGNDKRSKAIREGYWKTLIDFKMYDNDGNGAEQTAVTPNINMAQAERVLAEHQLGRQMPDMPNGQKGAFIPMESNNSVPVAKPAGDVYIELIKQRRAGNKPTSPLDSLEASPGADIDVGSLGQSQFHNNTGGEAGTNATVFGATQAPSTLGNVQNEQAEDYAEGQQAAMAIDAETGETVQRRYSLPSDAPYLAAVERGEMDEAQALVEQRAEETMTDSAIRDEVGRLLKVYHGTSEQFNSFDMSKGRANMDIQGAFFSPWELDAEGYGENVRGFYLNITNPASEHEGYAALRRFEGQNEAGKKAREYLISQGYDGVVNGVPGQPEEIIAFYPEQIKLADPITYDNNGNIIPLSERFNRQTPDIRYSLPSEDILRQVIRQYLRDGGSLALNTLDQYAAPLEGNNPNATSNRGEAQRQFGSRTLQQSDEIGAQAKQWIKERSAYTPDTNAAQLDRAMAWIRSNKTSDSDDGLYSSLQIVTNDNFDYRSADGQARMVALMGIAAAKGDVLAQTTLADAYNRQGTDLGRMLQARKMFLLMTPDGRKQSLKNMAKQVENEFLKKGYQKEIKFSDWVLDAAASAQTEEEFDRVRKAAAGEIAEQMPASWKEKLQGWRMLSMLGNPRTHIRNILGNLMFMPAVAVKNKVGALAEIVSRQDERTKTLGLASSEARAFAKEDAQYMQGILTGEAKYNEMTQIQQQRKTWGQGTGIISRTLGRGLQAVSDFNSGMLEKEDWIFLQKHYRNALAGYMTANHLTAADMKGTTLINARAYAVQEAQKATYRDASKLASTLSKIGREGGVAGFIVNAALPFKKTPANILKRGLEYSPAGLLKAISADAYHLKQWHDYQDGKLAALPEKALSPTQWIDRLASGLTGTGILALGAALCKAGFVTAGFGDDDDEFDRLEGDQEYALKLHVLGHDVSYTIDWAAPSCMPFFVGATIANTFGKDIEMDKLADALLGITEPVFNLSMLDGVNSLLDVNSYGEGNPITQIGEKVLTNYASSYVPTIAGQIARTIDTTRRKSYVESGASLSTIRYAIEQTENKIPFLSKTNIPYRNAWGEADVSPQGWAIIENFISPGYGATVEQDAVTEELRRLYQATGDKGMIPKLPSKTLSVNKETVKLNAEQYDQLTVERGQTAKQTLEAIMQTAEWQMADDFTRADMVSDVWTYANQTANTRIDSGANKTAWVAAAENDGTIVASIVDRAVSRNQNEYVNGHKKSMLDSLEAGDIDTALTSIEALRDMGKKDDSIKSYITNYFQPIWKEAINDDQDGVAKEIESTLDELTDFTFDYSKWMTDEDEEPAEVETDWLTKRN